MNTNSEKMLSVIMGMVTATIILLSFVIVVEYFTDFLGFFLLLYIIVFGLLLVTLSESLITTKTDSIK